MPFAEFESRESPLRWMAAALGIGVLLVILALRTGLFDLDEGFYAAVAGEMVRTGDYLTPRYAGLPFFEKPPLLYWAMSFFLRLGFDPVLAVRLPSIFAAVGTLLLVGYQASRRGSGAFAVIGLGLTPLFLGLGHMAFTDMLLTFCLCATFLLFWRSVTTEAEWLRVPAAALLGLATLTKGPVAGALFVLVAGITFATQPQLRDRFRKHWVEAILVYVAVAAPWYWLVYRKHGGAFFQEFILRQNLGRFQGGDTAHAFPFYFYIPVLIVGFYPWSLFLPSFAARTRGEPLFRFCWSWFWVVFGLFSLSGTKLPSYILPLFPPLAMMLPLVPGELHETANPVRAWSGPIVAARLVALLMAAGMFFGRDAHGVSPSVASALLPCALTLLASICLLFVAGKVLRPEVAQVWGMNLLAGALTLPIAFLVLPAHWVDTQRDISLLARDVANRSEPYKVYGVHPGHPSLMFEIGRPGQSVSTLDNQIGPNPTLFITQRDRVKDFQAKERFISFDEVAARGKYVALRVRKTWSP